MTLVEILVVLAILAALTAVAIPGFMRMGLFSRNDLLSSARELHALLNSAKIYAVTYRVPTGVVFDNPDTKGAGDASTMRIFRAAAMVYQHPDPSPFGFAQDEKVFVPVTDQEGRFRILPGATCLFPYRDGDVNQMFAEGGMTGIDVWVPDSGEGKIEDLHANVFEPSGRLREPGRERYLVRLCYDPTETEDTERLDQNGDIRTVEIEIYRSTGRVQVVKGEGDV